MRIFFTVYTSSGVTLELQALRSLFHHYACDSSEDERTHKQSVRIVFFFPSFSTSSLTSLKLSQSHTPAVNRVIVSEHIHTHKHTHTLISTCGHILLFYMLWSD